MERVHDTEDSEMERAPTDAPTAPLLDINIATLHQGGKTKSPGQGGGEEPYFPAMLRSTVTEARVHGSPRAASAGPSAGRPSLEEAEAVVRRAHSASEPQVPSLAAPWRPGAGAPAPAHEPPAAAAAAAGEGEGGGGGEEAAAPHCAECEDQHAEVQCRGCGEPFCRPCWQSLHRRGARAEHHAAPLLGRLMAAPAQHPEPSHKGSAYSVMTTGIAEEEGEEEEEEEEEGEEGAGGGGAAPMEGVAEGAGAEGGGAAAGPGGGLGAPPRSSEAEAAAELRRAGFEAEAWLGRCRFVPLRLTAAERELLTLLDAALAVSEYTDEVDTVRRWDKAGRVRRQLEMVLATAAGLQVVGGGLARGKRLLAGPFAENAAFFRALFEVGRRYKVMNPEKLRANYGKLMYLLQDSQAEEVTRALGFSLVAELQMVQPFLAARAGGLALLGDPRTPLACEAVVPAAAGGGGGGKPDRGDTERRVARKRRLQEELRRDYLCLEPPRPAARGEGEGGGSDGDGGGEGGAPASPSAAALLPLTEEDIQRVLDSLSDANNYLAFNAAPVEAMRARLEGCFARDKAVDPYSLRIGGGARAFLGSGSRYFLGGGGGGGGGGRGGAKLNHDHATQFTFVQQTLCLWEEVMANMFKLWYYADQDLLAGGASYHLANTGQGLQRVQGCPNVGREMRRVLARAQRAAGAPWVGLSVVHLGDRDVPNALVFIDKYTQVPRILQPIVQVLEEVDRMARDPDLAAYFEHQWASPADLKMEILADFFKHGFDGDGDDGGSCIDGRLTSAWNWCSRLGKKRYYHVFNLSGFQGFDGDWKD